MVSFSLGELQLSYDYFKRMTWQEFRLRLFAWKRQQKRIDYRQRDVMYQIMLSGWIDGKKTPPTKNQFWPIDKVDKSEITKGLEALRRAQLKYKKT